MNSKKIKMSIRKMVKKLSYFCNFCNSLFDRRSTCWISSMIFNVRYENIIKLHWIIFSIFTHLFISNFYMYRNMCLMKQISHWNKGYATYPSLLILNDNRRKIINFYPCTKYVSFVFEYILILLGVQCLI